VCHLGGLMADYAGFRGLAGFCKPPPQLVILTPLVFHQKFIFIRLQLTIKIH
jgi:hypothetical protein